MSDWLEEQLSQHLHAVKAPENLAVSLGFERAKRHQVPRMIVAIAAAIVMMAGGLAANREARNGEAVQFAAADQGTIPVRLGHQASGSAEKSSNLTTDASCGACHSL
jgi:hypothetical protein